MAKVIPDERIQRTELINIFPSSASNGDHVFIMTAITDLGNRVLIYAPLVKLDEKSIKTEDLSGWFDCYNDICKSSLYQLARSRFIKFFADMYAVKETSGEFFFKVFYLDQFDGIFEKPKIDKQEIEKLFGCEVNG